MAFILIYFFLILLLLFKPFINELPTLYQIVRSWYMPKINFKEKFGPWAIVTGCTDGIGKSISFELARRGLNIILISRSSSKLEQVASEIEATAEVKTKIIVADFSKGREIYKDIEEKLKGFDLDIGILVNNVGIAYPYPMYFGEVSEDEIWSLINVNVGAATQLTRLILPSMVSKGRGAIVNVSSAAKLAPGPMECLYSASKIFLDYFTEGLKHEYPNSGITFQTLCPFYVNTKISDYCDYLRRTNLFIPDPDTYAYDAVNTLGRIDNTTGYWPHQILYTILLISPIWAISYTGGLWYKYIRKNNRKKKAK